MKVGDFVKVVPEHAKPTHIDAPYYGVVVEMFYHEHSHEHPDYLWCMVLCTDTGNVEKFHCGWCEVISEGKR